MNDKHDDGGAAYPQALGADGPFGGKTFWDEAFLAAIPGIIAAGYVEDLPGNLAPKNVAYWAAQTADLAVLERRKRMERGS